ncbi:cell envelope-related transcriptional attenuator [Actinobacteria bacterium OK074]|nr:cell envelope-related transcriptional attenuator [Actinobacteria bacterium OK074]
MTDTGPIRRRRRPWLRRTLIALAALLLVTALAGWLLYVKLDGNITADNDAAAELARYEKERPTALVKDAQNILVIGSDSRTGAGNRRYGRDSGTERSDTTILLHLAADRRSATAVSLPRDLMVAVPSCRRADGSRSSPVFTLFNSAFAYGGSACTIRTVEKLTGIRVDHHVVVDFGGFKDMVDAVDGVEVCLAEPVDDRAAKLRLPAGNVVLDGEQALGYVRARKSLGDGSDTERMDRQQRFLGALVTKVLGDDVLFNPVKLYPVLDSATSALTTDPALANLHGLYQLVRGLRNIPTEQVRFLTVPRTPYAYDANRDQLLQPAAGKLFELLRTDSPVQVTTSSVNSAPGPEKNPFEGAGESPYEGTHPFESRGRAESGHNSEDRINAYGNDVDTYGDNESTPAPAFRGNTAAADGCG